MLDTKPILTVYPGFAARPYKVFALSMAVLKSTWNPTASSLGWTPMQLAFTWYRFEVISVGPFHPASLVSQNDWLKMWTTAERMAGTEGTTEWSASSSTAFVFKTSRWPSIIQWMWSSKSRLPKYLPNWRSWSWTRFKSTRVMMERKERMHTPNS